MLERYYNTSLLIIVIIAAALAVGLYALGASFLTAPIMMGDTYIVKSIAALAKDALFVPLKPIMYALIILSIGASIAVSRGGLGAKFVRVLGFFLLFSIIGATVAIAAHTLFPTQIIDPNNQPGLIDVIRSQLPLLGLCIIVSAGVSFLVSRGKSGQNFLSLFGALMLLTALLFAVAIAANMNLEMKVFETPVELGLAESTVIEQIPFMQKIYGVITSPLMISIYGGLLLGRGLKRLEGKVPGIGKQADIVSDMFIAGFIKFLWITIPLAVFGSLTLALNRPGGVETLGQLAKLLPVYLGSMVIVWGIMVLISARILGHGLGFMGRALIPQAVVAMATSSSMATLPATRVACSQLGANADESTPFYTIGATINMVGTLMGLTLLSLYGMQAYGVDVTMGDRIVVALQSMIYATSAAGVPSSSVILLQEILTSQGVSGDFAIYVTGLIITIDTLILDRMRTTLNTQSDSMSTVNGLHLYYKKPQVLDQ